MQPKRLDVLYYKSTKIQYIIKKNIRVIISCKKQSLIMLKKTTLKSLNYRRNYLCDRWHKIMDAL